MCGRAGAFGAAEQLLLDGGQPGEPAARPDRDDVVASATVTTVSQAPVTRRWSARAHTVSAANGSTATVMTATPVNVPTQPCHPLITLPPLRSDREIYLRVRAISSMSPQM